VRQLIERVRRWEIGDWLWAYLVVSVGIALGISITVLMRRFS
jgi:hypothetical protein